MGRLPFWSPPVAAQNRVILSCSREPHIPRQSLLKNVASAASCFAKANFLRRAGKRKRRTNDRGLCTAGRSILPCGARHQGSIFSAKNSSPKNLHLDPSAPRVVACI